MNRKNGCVAGLLLLGAVLGTGRLAQAQTNSPQAKLSVHWEELTGPDFLGAIQRSQGTCLLPFGILEKHGPHMPIGSDLLNARYAALHAAEQQYAVVFPAYYFGQISEARHEPGTIAYSRDLQLALLQATTDEMARNGCKKILIVNGHGGPSRSWTSRTITWSISSTSALRRPAAPKRKPPLTRMPVKAKPQR